MSCRGIPNIGGAGFSRVDDTVTVGETWAREFALEALEGEAYDASGMSADVQIKALDGTVLAEPTVTVEEKHLSIGPRWVVTWSLDLGTEAWADSPGRYTWGLWIEDQPILQGDLFLRSDSGGGTDSGGGG